jgi:hypothetical protein
MPQLDLPTTRASVLRTAEQYITHDRAEEHGDIADNFQCIADYWSAHLSVDVTRSDVAIMMALVKVARLKSNVTSMDNWVDGCGYLACGAELATRE